MSSELITCWLFELFSGKEAPSISSETAETLTVAGSLQTLLVSFDSLFNLWTTSGQLGWSDDNGDVLQDWRWSFVASFSLNNVCSLFESHFVNVPRILSEKLTPALRLEGRFSFSVAFAPTNH